MNLKCVVIGPPKCGKTSLIKKYMTGRFPEMLANDSMINYNVNLIYKTKDLTCDELNENWNFSISLLDYNLNERSDIKAELTNIDVLIMCYDATSKASFELLESFYRNYIKIRWPNVPKVLVGCLSDLLKDENGHINKSIDGLEAIQCAAFDGFNVDEIFLKSFKKAIDHTVINRKQIKKDELENFEMDRLKISNNKEKVIIREIPVQHFKINENEIPIKWHKVEVQAPQMAKIEKPKSKLNEYQCTTVIVEKVQQTASKKFFKLKLIMCLLILLFTGFLMLTSYCCQETRFFSIYRGSKAFLNESLGSFNNCFNELLIHATDISLQFYKR